MMEQLELKLQKQAEKRLKNIKEQKKTVSAIVTIEEAGRIVEKQLQYTKENKIEKMESQSQFLRRVIMDYVDGKYFLMEPLPPAPPIPDHKRLLDIDEVSKLVDLHPTSIWRLMEKNEFILPIRVYQDHQMWLRSEVMNWIKVNKDLSK